MTLDFLHLAGAAFLELPQLGVIVTDTNNRVAYWSKGAERLFEIDSDHAVDQQVGQVIKIPDLKPAGKQELCTSVAAVESHGAEKSDRRMLVETTSIPLRDEHYNIAGFLLVMQDVSERTRVEQARSEAEEANRAKDKFLAMVAHELRTPLSAIINWTERGIGGIKGAEIARAFKIVVHNARYLSRLIEDLLDISRTVACKLRLEVGPVRLDGVIEKVIHSLGPEATSKSIGIETTLDDSVGNVAGDPDRLQQIVSNLLSNAIKFTPDAGFIEVKLERAGSKARFTVSDTGPGISEDFLPYIFDPFTQANAPSTKRRGGLGLGLAMTRHLIELHNGTIQVNSREGHGASFIVEMPLWRSLLTLK